MKPSSPYRGHIRLGLAAAVVTSVAAFACGEAKDTAPRTSERTCSDTQALTATHYLGTALPAKTLALTFDDGPGVRTLELSHWLRDRTVPATFFVNGKMVRAASPTILADLVADGHLLANHGETHADLTLLDAGSVVLEVTTTDALLAPFVKDGRFLFRPPYNAFDAAALAALQASPMAKYVGPIDWDIGAAAGPQQAADWDCWQPIGTSDPPIVDVKTCGDLYLAEIHAKDHGIVLLHDPYFIGDDPAQGGTVDMVKYIVPILLAEGYRFVAVDEVPSIASALPPKPSSPHDAGAETSTTTPTAAPSSTSSTPDTHPAPSEDPPAPPAQPPCR